MQELRQQKEQILIERQTVLQQMLRRLGARSRLPDHGKEDIKIDQREAKVIDKINCMRIVGAALATLPEHYPQSEEEAKQHFSQLQQLSGTRSTNYYNFVPEN